MATRLTERASLAYAQPARTMSSPNPYRMLRPESSMAHNATASTGNRSGLLSNLEIAPTRQRREHDAPLAKINGVGSAVRLT
jgi:hypothetical protein